MDALLYLRWSTKDQSQGDSFDRQTKLGNQRAAEHGWQITETLIDHGKSAYHGRNRSQGGQLYEIEERAKRGELRGKVLLVEAMDRLSRQKPLESISLIRDLTQNGLTICETSSGRIYNTQAIDDNWTTLIVILAGAAEAYGSSHEKSKRVKSAWGRTQATGKTKAGEDDPRLCPSWIEVKNGKYRPIKERAAIINQIFQWCADGYGLRQIADLANENRAKINWPSANWHMRNINTLLRGRRVLGEYTPQERTESSKRRDVSVTLDLYPAVVSHDLYNKAQHGLSSRKGTGGPRRQVANVLSHLARCTYIAPGQNLPCGSTMTLRPQKRGPNQIACGSFVRAGGCKCNANYRYDDILRGVVREVFSLALPEDQRKAEPGFDVEALQADIDRRKARLKTFAARLIESDDDALFTAYEEYKAAIMRDEAALTTLQPIALPNADLTPAEIARRAEALYPQLDESADARRLMQSYLDRLIDAIYMDHNDRSATIVMMGGYAVIKLDKRGEFLSSTGAMRQLAGPDSEALLNIAAQGDPTKLAQFKTAQQRLAS